MADPIAGVGIYDAINDRIVTLDGTGVLPAGIKTVTIDPIFVNVPTQVIPQLATMIDANAALGPGTCVHLEASGQLTSISAGPIYAVNNAALLGTSPSAIKAAQAAARAEFDILLALTARTAEQEVRMAECFRLGFANRITTTLEQRIVATLESLIINSSGANLTVAQTDTILHILRTDGTFFTYVQVTPERAAVLRANAVARGDLALTGTEVRVAVARLFRTDFQTVVGSTSQSRLASTAARVGALRSILLSGRALGGIFFAVATEVGFRAVDVIQNLPLNVMYRQGRLQLRNIVATEDSDRCGVGNVIYYTPINGDPILSSMISLRDRRSNNEIWQPYRIVTSNGTVATLDLSQPSRIPFGYDLTKIEAQNGIIIGRPIDIFMCSPDEAPSFPAAQNGTGGVLIAVTPANNPFATPDQTPPGGRANNAPVAENVRQLPRMFYLNWKSNTERRVAGIGHYLIWNDHCGYCLGTKLNNENTAFDSLPGFFLNERETGLGKYIYLGSAIPVTSSGLTFCVPGCRLLTNYLMTIGYNDYRQERTPYFSISNLDLGIRPMRRIDEYSVWFHNYLNPRTALVGPRIFQNPSNGQCNLEIAGALGVYVRSNRTTMNATITDPDSNSVENNVEAEVFGNNNFRSKKVRITNLVLPPDTANIGGLNKIEVMAEPPPAGNLLTAFGQRDLNRRKFFNFIGCRRGDYTYAQSTGVIRAGDIRNFPPGLENTLPGNDPPVTDSPIVPPNSNVTTNAGFGVVGVC